MSETQLASSASDAPDASSTPAGGTTTTPARRRRRPLVIAGVGAVAVVAIAAGAVVLTRDQSTTVNTKSAVTLQPVAVVKRDLATYTTASGTLGYGDPITISEGGGQSAGGASTGAASGSGAATGAPASTSAGTGGDTLIQATPATYAPATTANATTANATTANAASASATTANAASANATTANATTANATSANGTPALAAGMDPGLAVPVVMADTPTSTVPGPPGGAPTTTTTVPRGPGGPPGGAPTTTTTTPRPTPTSVPTDSGAGTGAGTGSGQGQTAVAPTTPSTQAGAATTGAKTATTTTTSPAGTTSSNTVTQLAAEGTTLNRGDQLYAVDNQPRVLFYGSTPEWRDLSQASPAGVDILQLNENLVALGYDPDHQIVVNDTFGDGTTAAVVRWQGDHGYEQNGIVKLGQMIYVAGPSRVGTHHAEPGSIARSGSAIVELTVIDTVQTVFAPAAGTLGDLPTAATPVTAGLVLFTIDGTATTAAFAGGETSVPLVAAGTAVVAGTPIINIVTSHRQVTTNVSVTDRAGLKVGDAVQVVFPDTSTKPGHISAIGSVASKDAKNVNATPTVPVTVTMDGNDFDPNLVSTPVTVEFVKQQSTGILAVPTGALISLKEGGFAVQVADGTTTKLVAVKPGLYADGWVEVSGNGIAEGTKVMVPS